jgi:hypothetical protein
VTGVLRATSESGDVLDDPSEDALFKMFQDLEAGLGTFLIVEDAADFRQAHALVTTWAFGLPGLHERATWRRLDP